MTNAEFTDLKIKVFREKVMFTHATIDNPYICKVNYSKELNAPNDLKFLSAGTEHTYWIGEIKIREKYNKKYLKDFGCYLTKTKYESLINLQKEIKEKNGIDVRIAYFNICQDGMLTYELTPDQKYTFVYKQSRANNYNQKMGYIGLATIPKSELIAETDNFFNMKETTEFCTQYILKQKDND